MREYDSDGRTLCEVQAEIFAKSIDYGASSPIFVRRFMNSQYCQAMDSLSYLSESGNTDNVFDELNQEYGKSTYGKEKYAVEELRWIGYIYRYWAYVYETPSRQIYKIMTGREMHKVYFAYHSLDPAQAIERILEAKGANNTLPLSREGRIRQGVSILRRLRGQTLIKHPF